MKKAILLTQNCALYYAQHKTLKRRAPLFQKFRAAARKQTPTTQWQLPRDEPFARLPLHWERPLSIAFISVGISSAD